MPYYAGFLTMLMFSFTIIKAWYTYRIPCIHFSFILKHTFFFRITKLPTTPNVYANERERTARRTTIRENEPIVSKPNKSKLPRITYPANDASIAIPPEHDESCTVQPDIVCGEYDAATERSQLSDAGRLQREA